MLLHDSPAACVYNLSGIYAEWTCQSSQNILFTVLDPMFLLKGARSCKVSYPFYVL